MPLRSIGFIGHPFHDSCKRWFYKPSKDAEWKKTKGFDKAIRKLLKIAGLKGAENTIPWPYHHREHWIPPE